jgi:hypothetical protein
MIHANLAGGGHGGGIRTSYVNGSDVENNPNDVDNWNSISIFNNMITNNVAAGAGGGISMFDTALIAIIHNTVANNDSTGTAGLAFSPGERNFSNPQPAGVVSHLHSSGLADAVASANVPGSLQQPYSNPALIDNIVWHNRSFNFYQNIDQNPTDYGLRPNIGAGEGPLYWDLAVLGGNFQLDPDYCFLTDLTDYIVTVTGTGEPSRVASGISYDDGTNLMGDPSFLFAYQNQARDTGTTVTPGEATTGIQVPAAFDEGGNFIQVRFGPLSIGAADYHVSLLSTAIDAGQDLTGSSPLLGNDFDGDPRPDVTLVDIGADEQGPSNPPAEYVRLDGATFYTSIAAAYADTDPAGGVIDALAIPLGEILDFNTVTGEIVLTGGYALDNQNPSNWLPDQGFTTINMLTISSGSVVISNMILQ